MQSELMQQVLAGVPADLCDPEDDASAVRRKLAPFHGFPLREGTTTERVLLDGVPAVWVGRGAARGEALFCHGGAFVSCDADAYLFYAETVAEQLGLRVLVVDYRRAPEHRFPAALDDCAAAYRALVTSGHDRLLLVGDSCGGGLALATAVRARDEGLPRPVGVLGLTPWVDLDTSGCLVPGFDPFMDEGWFRHRVRDYLGPEGDPHDPLASPARADLDGLPPVLLQVGEVDLHRQDAELLAARSHVEVDVVAGGVHGLHGLVGLGVPEAVAAWDRADAFVDGCLR